MVKCVHYRGLFEYSLYIPAIKIIKKSDENNTVLFSQHVRIFSELMLIWQLFSVLEQSEISITSNFSRLACPAN